MTHNRAAVDLLAARLPAGLVHPGDPERDQPAVAIPLPGLSGTGIPDEMAAHFAEEAGLPHNDAPRLLAEAIVHLLESDLAGGSTIIADTELAQLRAATAQPPEGTRLISVHCRCDNTESDPLVEFTVANRDHIAVNGRNLLLALASRSPDCPHRVIG